MKRTQFKIRDLGIIVNPKAGAGKAVNEKIVALAIEIFSYISDATKNQEVYRTN